MSFLFAAPPPPPERLFSAAAGACLPPLAPTFVPFLALGRVDSAMETRWCFQPRAH